MNPLQSFPRRRRKTEFGPEPLETRELMTGGHNTFAILPGTVDRPGGTTAIEFTISPANFTLPRRSVAMGIDIVADSGSTIKPLIASVDNPNGDTVPQTFHSIYDPHLSHKKVASGVGTSAVLTPISLFPGDPSRPATYSVNVEAEAKSSGNFLLGFYLPGDVDGNGAVTKDDVNLVRRMQGARAGQSRYNFDADANRDGRIGKVDLAFTRQNLGVSTNISPTVAANYDNASDVGGLSVRTTMKDTAHFTGSATPGSQITYADVANKVASTTTTADAAGNYSINVPLAIGTTTFQVTANDAFGQTIKGTIAPVSHVKPS